MDRVSAVTVGRVLLAEHQSGLEGIAAGGRQFLGQNFSNLPENRQTGKIWPARPARAMHVKQRDHQPRPQSTTATPVREEGSMSTSTNAPARRFNRFYNDAYNTRRGLPDGLVDDILQRAWPARSRSAVARSTPSPG